MEHWLSKDAEIQTENFSIFWGLSWPTVGDKLDSKY